jgi:hypothetical protein
VITISPHSSDGHSDINKSLLLAPTVATGYLTSGYVVSHPLLL